MGLFKKKADPITDRARALKAQIAELENQIRDIHTKIEDAHSQPRLRSTALPTGEKPRGSGAPEPIFEPVQTHHPGTEPDQAGRGHYNDLGVRKYDLLGAWRRLQSHFRGPPASNPKLISYLAAGSIKGLRPLRYEKRVARNRFIALFIFFLLVLWALLAAVIRHYTI